MAHDGGEVSAGRGTPNGELGEIEGGDEGAGCMKPDERFPGVVDSGGVGIFGAESAGSISALLCPDGLKSPGKQYRYL